MIVTNCQPPLSPPFQGGETAKAAFQDIERDKFLNSQGIEVLRYRNEQVMKNMEGVLEDIVEHCKKREKEM